MSDPSKPKDEKEQEPRSPDLRFVALSKIKPLPGTYVKDEPRKDYSGLIADIKKNGLQKPVILRKSEKEDEFQLVDGFHRCKALEQAGMLEVRADVYEMSLAQASEYRKGHRDKPLMPVPGKLVPYPPEEPAKADKAPEAPAVGDEELPENLKIPLTKEGQPETVTTMKVANIRPFEGHPFAVRDNKDMWDLVDSIKKFGVLEPVMVIPHKDGGYEMVSGHRRMRACQLAGIENIPVIVRNLDRDEAIISMVDSNLSGGDQPYGEGPRLSDENRRHETEDGPPDQGGDRAGRGPGDQAHERRRGAGPADGREPRHHPAVQDFE
ncbi:MAG: ParB/RepB/Spo0J family partition protein [Dysosmobacter welbionis]